MLFFMSSFPALTTQHFVGVSAGGSDVSYTYHIQCTVNENKNKNILFHFREELGTCVECKPTTTAPTFETSLREARVG